MFAALPELSHVQYLVLRILRDHAFRTTKPVEARDLRKVWLAAGAGNRSLPAFYQFMQRLVAGRFVEASTTTGRTSYRITAMGRDAIRRQRAFYKE
jgi:DNA-binding PadR family transcriptional regulator